MNTGTTNGITETMDLERSPRILNGKIDMGCYQYRPKDIMFSAQ